MILDPRFQFMDGRGFDYSSQFGEDGYIEAILKRMGTKNQWCFEVGAMDGEYCSNTKRLREAGWNAVLIEGAERWQEKLQTFASKNVRIVKRMIGPDSLDEILSDAGAPQNLDLGVIDIDGREFECWKGMKLFRPRVMLVEFWPYGLDSANPTGQAGLDAIIGLGKQLGYAAVLNTFCNLLFVLESEL